MPGFLISRATLALILSLLLFLLAGGTTMAQKPKPTTSGLGIVAQSDSGADKSADSKTTADESDNGTDKSADSKTTADESDSGTDKSADSKTTADESGSGADKSADSKTTADESDSGTDKSAGAGELGFSTGYASGGLDILKALGAFALVMVLLFASLKGLSRLSRFRGTKGTNSNFVFRGTQSLDNRKYLAAVEIEGRIIVVGVTPDNIIPVAHWFSATGADGGLNSLRPTDPEAKVNFSAKEPQQNSADSDNSARNKNPNIKPATTTS